MRLTLVRSHQNDLAWLANEVGAGRLKTVIDEVFPLERLADALRKSQGGHARGKIIVSLS